MQRKVCSTENGFCILIAYPEYATENKYYNVQLESTSFSTPTSEISMNIDWGDGNSETINGDFFAHHDYSSDTTFSVIKVSVNGIPDKFKTNLLTNGSSYPLYTLECFLGKNVGISSLNVNTVLHVKTFGGVPTSVDDRFIKLGNSANVLQCFETTEPWEYIPKNQFQSCYALLDFDFSAVKEIGDFGIMYCYNLHIIDAPLLTRVGNSGISYNHNLIKINIPSCISADQGAFQSDYSLKEFNAPLIESLGPGCFSNDHSLFKISSFENLSVIPTNCFANCYSLLEIDFPNVTIVQSGSFIYNETLKKVSLPKCQEIQNDVFKYCYGLISINAPMCDKVGDSACASCYALYDINFSSSVTYGINAFNNCYLIKLKNQV